MLDIKQIRENPAKFNESLKKRGMDLVVEPLILANENHRKIITSLETMQKERNDASKIIGTLAKEGGDVEEQKKAVRELGEKIHYLEEERRIAEDTEKELLLAIPNTLHDSVPSGTKEEDNVIERSEGEKKQFDFEPKSHWDLGDELGIFDFPRAAKMTGAGYAILKGDACRLQRALIQFMLDVHTAEHGFTEMETPFVCNTESMTGTGQLPKMVEDMYKIQDEDLWLIPTAEVPLTNYYRDEIISDELPIYLTGYTPCFRREAGAAGKMTRGLNRLHQFDKVEMVKFVQPETSYDELESLLVSAENIIKKLGLHYRVLTLCSGDTSFASAKTYDIELWAPGQDAWLEVSSVSNFEDFQARRANIRYRGTEGKPRFVHTLNGSGVALPRLMVAILENGQQADGSIIIPEAIRPYLGGKERITANA